MFCSKCGAKVSAGANFCPKCGSKITVNASPSQSNVNDNDSREIHQDSAAAGQASQNRSEDVCIKESAFDMNMRMDRGLFGILMVVLAVIAIVNAVHVSGLLETDTSDISSRRVRFIISFARLIPDAVNSIISYGVEVLIFVVLMKFFSVLRRPLKGWFVTNIVCMIILFSLDMMSNLVQESPESLPDELNTVIFFVMISAALVAVICELGLGIALISCYAGSLKNFAFVLIVRVVIDLTMAGISAVQYVDPLIQVVVMFFIDFFYYLAFMNLILKPRSSQE